MTTEEQFTSGEWQLVRYGIERLWDSAQELGIEGVLDSFDRKVSRLSVEPDGKVQVTVVQPSEESPSTSQGRWGEGGPGSDTYFSFAD